MIVTDYEDGAGRLTVRGELTHAEADRLVREALGAASGEREPGELIIDLLEVTDCDTSGVAALVRIARGCDLVGCRMVLASVGPRVADVLERNGFAGWFEGAPARGDPSPLGPASESTVDELDRGTSES